MEQVRIEERTEIEGVYCPFSGGLCRMKCRIRDFQKQYMRIEKGRCIAMSRTKRINGQRPQIFERK